MTLCLWTYSFRHYEGSGCFRHCGIITPTAQHNDAEILRLEQHGC